MKNFNTIAQQETILNVQKAYQKMIRESSYSNDLKYGNKKTFIEYSLIYY